MAIENIEKNKKFMDSALRCFVIQLQRMGIDISEDQIRRSYVMGKNGMDKVSLVRIAREMGIKASLMNYTANKKAATFPLPAIAVLANGKYVILEGKKDDKLILFDPYREQSLWIEKTAFSAQWTGQIILLAKKRMKDKSLNSKTGILPWLGSAFRAYKKVFGKILMLSVILQVFGLIMPLFMQVIINKVLVQHNLQMLHLLAFGMVVVCLFKVWISGIRRFMLNHYVSQIDVRLSAKLFHHLLGMPLHFFERFRIGEITARMRELNTIRQFIIGSAFSIILDVGFSLIYLVILFVYSHLLTMITLASLLLYVLLNLSLTPILKRKVKEKFRLETEKQAFLIEAVNGIETIKSMAVESAFIREWDEKLAEHIKAVFSIANIDNFGNNIARIIQQVCMVAILWVGVKEIMDGNFTVGELIAFQMYSNYVVTPILRLVELWQNLQQAKIAVHHLNEILAEKAEPAFNPGRTTLPQVCGEISLEQITFRYRAEEREVLHKIDLNIKAGSKVGFVGRSGSGKSTLTKIIQRLYLPEEGIVRIDGVDMAQVEPAWLRRHVGVVLQDTCLFRGNIWSNIALAKNGAQRTEIENAAHLAGVDQFVKEMPKGYLTPIGERGVSLSGGQKQRIAIARALINDPKILIFDEATSALDTESEYLIRQNIEQIASGRTLIMVAHRLSTVENCDKIFFMEEGKVLEEGTHGELMKKQGRYYHLYCQQAL